MYSHTVGLLLVLALTGCIQAQAQEEEVEEIDAELEEVRVLEEIQQTTDVPEEPTTSPPPLRPGFRGRITQKGLDYARSLGLEMLMRELQRDSIPDVEETVAGVEVKVKDITIVEFPEPISEIVPLPGLGVRWMASQLNPIIEANYTATLRKWFFDIRKEGGVRVEGQNMQFKLDLIIGRDADGHLMSWTLNCEADGDVELSFHGDWSDMLNFGSSIFQSRIASLVTSQICAKATEEINKQMQGELGTLPVKETVADDFELNFGLLSFPVFSEEYLETFHNGTVYLKENPEAPPFSPPVIPVFRNHTEKMVYLYVTDYLLNSGFHAGYLNNQMAQHITKDLFPANLHPYLETSCILSVCLGTAFPQLQIWYPDSYAEIDLYANRPPWVDITGNQLSLDAAADAELYVRDEDGVRTFIFSVNMTLTGAVDIHVNGSRVIFNIKSLRPEADVKNNDIGLIIPDVFFETALALATSKFILPKLRDLGSKGIDLPNAEGVEFVDPFILDEDTEGVMVVATDIRFDPALLRPLDRVLEEVTASILDIELED